MSQDRDLNIKPEYALAKPTAPPSPEASALGKYGNTPVNLSSGIPNINIPLYSINIGQIIVPISINYNNNGIKVNDVATNVGLGWTLFAGGVIATSSSDKSDLHNSSRNLPIDPKTFSPNNITADYNFAMSYISGFNNYDLQPDIYNYNFSGNTGKFFMDASNEIGYTISKNTLKITKSSLGFLIIDQKGTKYEFNQSDLAISEESCSIGSTPRNNNSINTKSFYLTKVIDINNNYVEFIYESYHYEYFYGLKETEYISIPSGSCSVLSNRNSICFKVQSISAPKIKQIISSDNNLNIQFIYSANLREDLQDEGISLNVNSLSKIRISNTTEVLKTIDFTQEYFRTLNYSPTASTKEKSLNSRLKLVSLKESGKKPYFFTYEEDVKLPARLSMAIDHYGLYNGKNRNTTLIPPFAEIPERPKGDREPDTSFNQAALLKKIVYPTGGASKFYYEPNKNYIWENVTTIIDRNISCGAGAHLFARCNFHLNETIVPIIYYNLKAGGRDDGSADLSGPDGFSLGFGGNGSYDMSLPTSNVKKMDPGDYSFFVENPDGEYGNSISINWKEYTTNRELVEYIANGSRIKKIVDSSENTVIKYYKYTYNDTSKKTSLFFKSPSSTNYTTNYSIRQTENPDLLCHYTILHSDYIPLIGKGDWSNYGYKQVTELVDSLGIQGKTVYNFSSNTRDFGTQLNNSQLSDIDWLKGIELNKVIYSYNPVKKLFSPLNSIKNTYNFHLNKIYYGINTNPDSPPNQYSLYGMSITQIIPPFQSNLLIKPAIFRYEAYPLVSAWYYLSKQEKIDYDINDSTKFVKNLSIYYYDNPIHMQATRVKTLGGLNDTLVVVNTFPDDYPTGTSFIDNMKIKNLAGLPIEKVLYKTKDLTSSILGGTLNLYYPSGSGLLNNVKTLIINKPIDLPNFKFSNQQNGAGPYTSAFTSFQIDTNYRGRITYNLYDNLGNPLMVTPEYSPAISYKWGYNTQYLIAECRNASNTEFYYEGFEESIVFGVIQGIGHTGVKYSLNTSVSWVRPNNRKYVISYYYMIDGIWKYRAEQAYLGSSFTLTGGEAYDDIRIYPSDAQMTTYTYSPLIGMTSQTDPKCQTTYYEYDSFQRLKNIKDQNGNIINSYTYNYKQ